MTASVVKPFNQRIRIAALRIFFVLCIPLILFTRSAWMDTRWVFEILEVIGLFFIIFAVLGRFWAVLYIGGRKNREIMQDGPYSICRHPLYLFSTLGVMGLGLMLGSLVLTTILSVIVFYILTATAKREEAFLRAEFGPDYDIYAARVPRIWPKLSLFHCAPFVTVNITTLKVNFFDALVFLAFILLAEFMEWIKEMGLVSTWPIY